MRTGACLAMVLLAFAGCAPKNGVEPAPQPPPDAPTGRDPFAPPSAELPTALPEGSVALEVLSWGTLDPDDTLGDRVASLARRPQGEMVEVARALRAQGLRLVRLDAGDVGAFFEITPPSGAVRRRIILPGARYEEVVDGVVLEEPRSVGTALGARSVGPGGAHISLRAWGAVRDDGGVDVRADLAGVIAPLKKPGRTEFLVGDQQRTLRGVPVAGLVSHLTLRTDEAWALIAASPDDEWTPFNAGADTPEPAERPVDPGLDSAAPRPVGPRVTPLLTSGEALFFEAPGTLALGQDDRARLVVLLVARAPERFSLFE